MIDKHFLINGALASSTTVAVSLADVQPILPIIIGVIAPIITELLFRFVDKISNKIKTKKICDL